MQDFQCAAVQAPDFAANKEKIAQQLLDLPPVRLRVIFEHDGVEIERRHAGQNFDLRAFGIDLHDLSLGQESGALVSTSTQTVDCSPIS